VPKIRSAHPRAGYHGLSQEAAKKPSRSHMMMVHIRSLSSQCATSLLAISAPSLARMPAKYDCSMLVDSLLFPQAGAR